MEKKLKNGGFAVEVEQLPELWRDRKRYLGMPLSFTSYTLNAEKLLLNTGLLNLREEEVLLYRVRDVGMRQSLAERIFGVGTICVTSSDATVPHLELVHVKNPRKVKDVLSKCVEESRRRNGIRSTELMGGPRPGAHEDDELPPEEIPGDGAEPHDEEPQMD